jgi:hypothetical protein
MTKQISIRKLLLTISMIAFAIQFNLYARVSYPSGVGGPVVASQGETWRNTKRSYGWPFEIFERTRQSLAHVVGKNANGGNVWSLVYYSNQIKPFAVLLNAAIGCFSVFAFYNLLTLGSRVLIRCKVHDRTSNE